MRIWCVLAAVAIVLILTAGQAQVAWSQETRSVEETPAADAQEPGEETPAPDAQEPDGEGGEKAGAPTTQGDGSPGGGQDRPRGGLDMKIIAVMIGVMVLLWWWMGRGRRKEQQRRKEMLSTLKKGDKVTSIGGVVGTVIEVKDKEVTVKVDESSNVRMKFARWAIRGVGEVGKAENPDQEPEKK